MSPQGPFKLVTVNTAPERAKRLIGRVVEDVKDRYTIIHAGNASAIDQVSSLLDDIKPEMLFCASMWTEEESDQIQALAREKVPGIKTMALPQGLQVKQGPDAVVEYIKQKLPGLIEGHQKSKL